MPTPILPMFIYSTVYNLLNFPPILIKFVSKFIVCKVLYFKAQYILKLRSPLRKEAKKKKKKKKNPRIQENWPEVTYLDLKALLS